MTQLRNIVITGANRGIGLEFCRQYSLQGDYKVWATCRQASSELSDLKVNIIEGVDISQNASLDPLKALENTPIHLLINNAGIFKNESLSDFNFEQMIEQFHVNCIGPLRITHALLNNLSQGAKVAMITSRMGSITDNSSGGYYGYRLSKTALNSASKSLAIDLKSKNIAVGLFHPGYVITAMTQHSGEITPEKSVNGLIPMIKQLNLDNSGGFWHSNGEKLPW